MKTKLAIPFPLKGLSTSSPWSSQPEMTSPSMLNVFPASEDNYRLRGGIRPGCCSAASVDASRGAINHLAMRPVVQSGKLVYQLVGFQSGTFWKTQGTASGAFESPVYPAIPGLTDHCTMTATSCIIGFDMFYLPTRDGASCRVLKGGSSQFVSLASQVTAGTCPVKPRLCAAFRNRLVLVGETDGSGDNFNFYCSRVGDPYDWDYAATDPAAAFAGNFMPSGRLQDFIKAVVPAREDMLYFFGEKSIYRMVGDPAFGGDIELVTDKCGIAGPRAWAFDPRGHLWFVSRHGLFRLGPDGALDNASEEMLSTEFDLLASELVNAQLAWDYRRKGLWIVMSGSGVAASSGSSGSGSGVGGLVPNSDVLYWYDERTGGFFPVQFGDDDHPVKINSILMYDGVYGIDSYTLFGGNDGVLYRLRDNTIDHSETTLFYMDVVLDNGNNVEVEYPARVVMGMVQPSGPIDEAGLIGVDVTLGHEASGLSRMVGCVVTVQCADGVYSAVNDPSDTRSFEFTSGNKQLPMGTRMCNNAFCVIVTRRPPVRDSSSGGTYHPARSGFSLEQVTLTFLVGGGEAATQPAQA